MVLGELGHVVHDGVVGDQEPPVGRSGEAVVTADVVQVHVGQALDHVWIELDPDPEARA